MKPQYKDHLTPAKFGMAVLKDGLKGADNGVINEHLCPLGNANVKSIRDVTRIGMSCVVIIDDILLSRMEF